MNFDYYYKNVLLAYIDILGFKKLIDLGDPEIVYNYFFKALEPHKRIEDEKNHPASKKARSINIQVVSDSIIMFTDMDNIDNSPEDFLEYLCEFCLRFTCYTGLLMRGAITKGNYYQKQIFEEKNQFIFSKAFLEAYQLEQLAFYPRILVSNTIDLSDTVMSDFIVSDFDGISVLNLYAKSYGFPKEYIDKLMQSIKINLCSKYEAENDFRIKQNIKYYMNYHNAKLKDVCDLNSNNMFCEFDKDWLF